jgi:lipoprotein-anchoring transpeptidase ErfK/SrfK
MTIKRILTVFATVAVSAAATSLACAQGTLPPGAYTTAPAPYPPSGYPQDAQRRDGMPDFDALDDEDNGRGPGSMALPAPGPILSPDDPRYGRPAGIPAYSDRGIPQGVPQAAVPQGPVMSPDDPRYGRPAGPPPVIYSDRPAGAPPAYSDRGAGDVANRGGFIYPGDDARPMRPPEAVGPGAPGAPPAVAGAPVGGVPVGQDGRPMQLSALPPDEQPEANVNIQLPPHLRRQEVSFPTKEPAGTIVVDTPNTQLYYVLGGGRAVRYGVRVGRDGFTWTGVQKISRKAEWPDWHPPTEMIERQPYLPRFMAGGPGNPLGARAMYLGSTVFRIHGTNQPSTIGKFVSSGCIGMLNEDVSDLFDRVKVGTRVVVLPGGPPPGATANAAPAPALAPAGQQPTAQAGPLPGQAPTAVPPLPAPVTIR